MTPDNPVQPVVTPVVPAATPGAAVTPVAAVADTVTPPVVQVDDPDVPLSVLEDEADDQEMVGIEDQEVPLANTDLVDNVKHCILHFIEWLLAAIMAGAYIGSTRKQKKEIAELKRELDDEEKRS